MAKTESTFKHFHISEENFHAVSVAREITVSGGVITT